MKNIFKYTKVSVKTIIYLLIFIFLYYILLFNLILSIFSALFTTYIYDKYLYYNFNMKKNQQLNFQINTFIKNMAINCLANDFNILDSLEKSSIFLEDEFKKDVLLAAGMIKKDYNYTKAFSILSDKYHNKRILKRFIKNLLIIKEQSNVDESAKKIFQIASKDSQKYIVYRDKVETTKKNQFINYLINTAIGYFVIVLVIFSLNIYYIDFAKSITGLIVNMITILISFYITLKLMNNAFCTEDYEY